jgi:DNA polymerase III epsilon subunit family exonuclease
MAELNELKFACLDTETTGLSTEQGGRICEIAVSVSQNGKLLKEYSKLINPQMPMHPDVVAIHGITNEMVASAPTFGEIAPELAQVLDGCILVAHNADFDMGFIRNEFTLCGCPFQPAEVIDTLKLARKSGWFAHNNLGLVAQDLGISNTGWHRAMADTKMAEQILYYFLYQLLANGKTALADLKQAQYTKWAHLGISKKEMKA